MADEKGIEGTSKAAGPRPVRNGRASAYEFDRRNLSLPQKIPSPFADSGNRTSAALSDCRLVTWSSSIRGISSLKSKPLLKCSPNCSPSTRNFVGQGRSDCIAASGRGLLIDYSQHQTYEHPSAQTRRAGADNDHPR